MLEIAAVHSPVCDLNPSGEDNPQTTKPIHTDNAIQKTDVTFFKRIPPINCSLINIYIFPDFHMLNCFFVLEPCMQDTALELLVLLQNVTKRNSLS